MKLETGGQKSISDYSISSFSQIRRGVLLGCFGGAIGFFTSSLVHYNLGDGEVAMIFFLLMGLGVYAATLQIEENDFNRFGEVV